MKKMLLGIVLAAFVGIAAPSAQSGYQLLQQGLSKENTEGNLKEAIAIYERVVKEFGRDRPLAAKALLQLGEAYQKLGDTQARTAFERIVRDYADQKDVVVAARSYLNAAAPSARPIAMTLRKVWAGANEVQGTVSPDGRHVSFVDGETGDLALIDLASGHERRLTNKGSWTQSADMAGTSAISRDGKQVAYQWYNSRTERYELRVTSIQAAGLPQVRRLFDSEDIQFITPMDWSPDGKLIAVSMVVRTNRASQIAVVAVQDGSLRVLKSMDRYASKIWFSPDGRDLAFEQRVSDSSLLRDVFVLAVDGSREVPAVIHPSDDEAMGWSPDGKYLLFASDRNGTKSLWALAIAGGQPQGAPQLVKPNIGNVRSVGITNSGALHMGTWASEVDIEIWSVEIGTGRQIGPPVRPIMDFIGSTRHPEWSPDRKHLAYVSNRTQTGRKRPLAIRSIETGQVRELEPKLLGFNWPRWAPDGRSFIAQGTDLKGRNGVFQIDAQTGDVMPITISPQGVAFSRPQLSPDAKKAYFRSATYGIDDRVIERDVASGDERELVRQNGMEDWSLSPDGRHLAVSNFDRPTKSSTVMLVPVAGGKPIELIRETLPVFWSQLTWTPDGRGVVAMKLWSENVGTGRYGKIELWMVPIDGGKPVKLGVDTPNIIEHPARVHPDGRQIAFVAGTQKSELWALENFLPALGHKK